MGGDERSNLATQLWCDVFNQKSNGEISRGRFPTDLDTDQNTDQANNGALKTEMQYHKGKLGAGSGFTKSGVGHSVAINGTLSEMGIGF